MKRCMHSAFTIIELLVVIAIITVLAALLLPVLQSAIEQARTLDCLSTQKQIGLGIYSFAEENGGRCPGGGHASNGSRAWQNIMNLTVFAEGPKVPRSGCMPNEKDLCCPSLYRPGGGSLRQWGINENLSSTTYGKIVTNPDEFLHDSYVWDEYHLGALLSRYARPSVKVMLADHERGCDRVKPMSGWDFNVPEFPYLSNSGFFTFRHDKLRLRTNFLFLDGHGESVGPESDLYASYHYGPN